MPRQGVPRAEQGPVHPRPIRCCRAEPTGDLSRTGTYPARVRPKEASAAKEDRNMAIGRSDLIKMVAGKAGKSAKETTEFVNATLESVKESLEKGETVRLVGFGVFSVKDTA